MENLTVPIRFKRNYFRKRNYCLKVVLCILSASKMKKLPFLATFGKIAKSQPKRIQIKKK